MARKALIQSGKRFCLFLPAATARGGSQLAFQQGMSFSGWLTRLINREIAKDRRKLAVAMAVPVSPGAKARPPAAKGGAR